MRSRLVALLFVLFAVVRGQEKAEYIGAETCALCHADLAEAFKTTRHQALNVEVKRGWKDKACEACHGPGSLHAESADVKLIVNPSRIAPARENATCLGCHRNQNVRVCRIVAGHANDQIACGECHRIHPKAGERLVETRKPEANAQCARCHATQRAEFERPHTHPLSQGAMTCTDCHNPHDAFGAAQKRVSFGNEPGCINCHTDLRGPFVYEHAPMRLEGCTACHQPHGSQNPRLLTRASVARVCLECHAGLGALTGAAANAIGAVPPSFHDITSPTFQACTTCHRRIHGSHVDRSLQR